MLLGAEVSAERTSRWWFVGAVVGSAALLVPTLGYGLGYDQGILFYLGRTLARGQWLYSDAFDTSFPGAPLLHALSIAVAGNSVLAFRIEDFVLQLAACVILFLAGRRLAGPVAGVYAAFAYASLYTKGGYYYTGERDGFMVPLLLFSLVALWEYWSRPARRTWLWLAGLSLGAACTIRPTYAILAVVATCGLLLRRTAAGPTTREERREDLRAAVTFALASALPLLSMVAAYVVTGRIGALRDLLEFISTVYPALWRLPASTVLLRFITFARRLMWVGALLSVFSPAWRVRRVEMASLMVFLASVVVVRLVESKAFPYQFWPFLSGLALCAGVGWVWLGHRLALRLQLTGRRALAAVAVTIAVVLLFEIGRTGVTPYAGLTRAIRATASDTSFRAMIGVDPQQATLARYLKDHTGPADSISSGARRP